MKHVKQTKTRFYLVFVVMAVAFCSLLLLPIGVWATEESSIPTIEALSQGKVKIGDTVDKTNVEAIKKYLPVGVYELVKNGMVMKMGKNLPPEKTLPKYFVEATEKNRGQAVIDDHKCVYLKDGSLWPGGLPFEEPKNGDEVMANIKYGATMDDYHITPYRMNYINKEGKIYKSSGLDVTYVWTTGRLKVPPLGAIPGEEDVRWKCLPLFTSPMDLKGLGQINIRYYDEVKKPDDGFCYLPAFKRVIRISATTYQDNMGGSDFTWGDQEGLREPYTSWNFKLIGKENLLMSALKGPESVINSDGSLAPEIKFTEGYKFPTSDWAVAPMYTVECTPNIKHIYSKKVLHVQALPYWGATGQVLQADIYDRQGRLWKVYSWFEGSAHMVDGDPYMLPNILLMHDIQTDHTTQNWFNMNPQTGAKSEDFILTKLIERGR